MKIHLLILFLLPSVIFAAKSGPENSYALIHDLGENWYTYNEDSKSYSPYIKGVSPPQKAHTTFLDLKENKYFSLIVKSLVENSYLFIDGQFFKKLDKDAWVVLSIKDLPSTQEEIAITFYGSTNVNSKTIFVGSKSSLVQTKGITKSNFLPMKLRERLSHLDSYIIILGLIFIFISILGYVNPKAFNEYFSFSDIFVTKLRDTKFLVSKPLNQINIAFLVLLSMITGLLYLLLRAKGVPLFQNHLGVNINLENSSITLTFIKATIVAFVIYFSKFFFLSITGSLFGLKKSVNIHYFKITQFNLFFLLLISLFFFAFIISNNSFSLNGISTLALWTAVLVYTSRTLIAFLSILKSTGIQSLYLFAYLCVVEILPIFLGIRFAF